MTPKTEREEILESIEKGTVEFTQLTRLAELQTLDMAKEIHTQRLVTAWLMGWEARKNFERSNK